MHIRRIALTILLASAALGATCQPVTFQKVYATGAGASAFNSMQQTTDGGYILAGQTPGSDPADAWLVKVDDLGTVVWQKNFGGSDGDLFTSVAQAADGGYVAAGSTNESQSDGTTAVYLVKVDATGALQWQKSLGSPQLDQWGTAVDTALDGGYVVAGYNRLNAGFIAKVGALGALQWLKTDLYDTPIYSVRHTSDGGYVLTGADQYARVFLEKWDASGNRLWSQVYGGSESQVGYAVRQTNDGGYVIAGKTSSYGAGGDDFYLLKTDSSGNLSWEATFGGPGGDRAESVDQTSDGGYIIAGYSDSFGAGSDDVYLVKTDATGNLVWQKTFGGAASDRGMSVDRALDGGYAVAGTTQSFLPAGGTYSAGYLIKTDSLGNAPPSPD